MKKLTLIALLAIAFAFGACKQSKINEMSTDNPLLQEFTNEYGIPPFDKIKTEHFLPAFKAAMEEQNIVIQQIVENKDIPTFENTIEAYEFSGLKLSAVSSIFYNFLSANTNEEMQQIAQDLASLSTAHWADIQYNADLFAKVEMVYKSKKDLALNQEQEMLLDETYKSFVRAGVGLPKEQQDKLREINEELSKLTLQFDNNNLAEVNSYRLVVDNEADLAGLPDGLVSEAAELAKSEGMENKWEFTIHKPVLIPFLQYAENRELREKIFKAYINLGDNGNEYDNKEIISKIVNLRVEKAHILGYNNYAEYVLEENMAKTPEKVYEFLNSLFEKALPVAEKEAKDLQDMIIADGKDFQLEPWDWWYYTEKIRQTKYDLNEEELREYFQLDTVLKGMFNVAKKLYNIEIVRLDEAPIYLTEAVPHVVKDATTGEHIGVIYIDFYPRASKQSGAWMDNYVNQYIYEGKEQRPVITNVLNFTKPSGDKPSLLSLDEVSTLFHEFGHALHGLLTQCTYPSLSGTSVARDFVELPSQVMENWAMEPSVIKTFAKHYITGEVIPDELLEKIENSAKFNQGFASVEYLAASLLDMDYHSISEIQDNFNVTDFENNSMAKIHMPDNIVVRYRSTYFGHIFAGGYSAGYYSYIWAAVLDADAYAAFKETGDVFNQEKAKAFRENILEKGGTQDPMELYVQFRGQEPKIEPLLERRGLM
ncbi:MAG: M3 family metallopeptidase [Bacteroidales bacterium]|nr:M3 family metallopeptidase [Bacteroidales bacterium]